ncbi:uncharacterized protein LOC111620308 [Centruroides sculpturatus]|uniref:uncharacterized protein LOC111620308 n=1 Tax=Centruroides sculpturatus TaxID=218467 RepID=UPI000C6CB5E3|nr:uncharacterized protein LOC111620308 [Centruroides sculpturatus]
MIQTNRQLCAFTGIQTFDLLNVIIKAGEPLDKNQRLLSFHDKVLLTLCKLKLNITFICIALLFKIPESTCRRYFKETLIVLEAVLKSAIYWPSKREVLQNLPLSFSNYTNVQIILDCTEFAVEKTKCLRCRICTYSHYKGDNTIKVLIGVSPAGLITFVSKAFGGRASDKAIIEQSGVLNKQEPFVDAVMVDKGFHIDEACAERNIHLIRPFLQRQTQFTHEQALETSQIASAWVHVERAIQRLKNFQILSTKLSWTMLGLIDSILCITTGIVNLSSPILDTERF